MDIRTVNKILDDIPLEPFIQPPYSLATRFVVFPFGISTVEVPMCEPGCHIAKGDPIGPMFWYVSPDSRLSYPQEYWLHVGEEDLIIYAECIGGQKDYYRWGRGTLRVFPCRPHYSRHRVRVELYPNYETAPHELALHLQRSLIAAVDMHGSKVVPAPKRCGYRWRLEMPRPWKILFNVDKTAYHWKAIEPPYKNNPMTVFGKSRTLTQLIRATASYNLFNVRAM